MRRHRRRLFRWSLLLLVITAPLATAAPSTEFRLVIKDQAFAPERLSIPAGQTIKILVSNEDSLPAEFESYGFNRETVIPGGSQVPVYVGPLKPGTYKFFNDFHPSSKGTLIVQPTGAKAGR